jgi:hypothetical protein
MAWRCAGAEAAACSTGQQTQCRTFTQRLLVCVPLLGRAMTSISWAFEIIEKFPDTSAHSGVCFWIIIAFDALRNSLGFVSNGFPRRLHFSKIEF